MALGIGDIFKIGASLLGGGGGAGIPESPTAPDIDYTRYMIDVRSPEKAVGVGGVQQTSAQYSQFLQAWDNYLKNDYLEMSKRFTG